MLVGPFVGEPHNWREVPSTGLVVKLFKHELPADDYKLVDASQLYGAVKLLSRESYIKLSKDEVNKYAPSFGFDSNKKYYLVRGLAVGEGRFYLYRYHHDLYVYSGTLGSTAKPHHAELVVASSVTIFRVYVNYSIAE
jgi:hypothetical protein